MLPDAYEGMKHRMKVLANGGKSKEASDDETGMVTDSMMFYFSFFTKGRVVNLASKATPIKGALELCRSRMVEDMKLFSFQKC